DNNGATWDAIEANQSVRFLPGGPYHWSSANAVNSDGFKKFGFSSGGYRDAYTRPTIWEGTVRRFLPVPGGYDDSQGNVEGCSSDGNVLFGWASYFAGFDLIT